VYGVARATTGDGTGHSGLRRWPLLAAVAVDSLGTGLYLPLSMLYFLRVTDLDLAAIGVLVSVSTALTLPVPLAVGRLVDRFGPRLVVAGGQAVQGLGFPLYLTVSGASSLVTAVLVTSVGLRSTGPRSSRSSRTRRTPRVRAPRITGSPGPE
jgi:hypothetical protein